MSTLPEPIARLISCLGRLPGIGPRSAERLALHLVQSDPESIRYLADTLVRSRENIRFCRICGALTEVDPCAICADSGRQAHVLCVVEQPTDILTLERSNSFHGRYHVLGGKISPMNGVEPEDLRIDELEKRLAGEPVEEIIIALATDVEGDATSHYLSKRFASDTVRVTRLAHGLPAGTGLEFADDMTLSHALEGRRELH